MSRHGRKFRHRVGNIVPTLLAHLELNQKLHDLVMELRSLEAELFA